MSTPTSVLVVARRSQLEAGELKAHLDKVNELEREHVRLQATQTLAQDKMRELEARLHEERHHRKLMQDRAAQVRRPTRAPIGSDCNQSGAAK